jgi:hypothetical protein
MTVGTMAEDVATHGHTLSLPLDVRLRSPSKCSGDRPGGPGGPDGREGLGWET